MAEDINQIQDAVSQLEEVIGLHANNLTLTERIDRISQSATLKTDKFVVYKGNPLIAYETMDEAIHSFSFVEHLVLLRQSQNGFNSFISRVIKANTKVYGYIDCTPSQALSVIQLEMEWWKSQGATGVFLVNYDYVYGNTRTRQNDILLSAQERGLRAVVTGDLNNTLFNVEHPLNPTWEPLSLTSKDSYYTENIFLTNSGIKNIYASAVALAKELVRAKEELGISIYVADKANGSTSATQNLYEHGHSLVLLFGLDGYFISRTDDYQLNDPIRYHSWAPFVGSASGITLIESISDIRRRTNFGEIIYAKSSNTVIFTGLTIPTNLIEWKENSLSGSAIEDNTIEDKKIKAYDGNRLVDSINSSDTNKKILLSRLENILTGDSLLQDMKGYVSAEALQVHIIEAINARIAYLEVNDAKIDSAIINELTVEHIKASVIEAINIAAGHAEIGSAYIHGAAIDELDAGKIRSGDILAERLSANVVNAVNANIGHAEIDSAVISEIRADRMQAEVVSAINLYAQTSVTDKAVIDSAIIGDLTVDHIKAGVIEAINANIGFAQIDKAIIPELDAIHIRTNLMEALEANIGTAVIDNALIGELTTYHLKGSVVDAINLSAKEAVIEGAKIKEATIDAAHIIKGTITNAEIADATIKTANIALGSVTSALIGEGQVNTINIAQGSITDALIKNLSADKINAGTINSSLVKIEGENGFLRLWGNRLQVFDNQKIPVERVALGDVNNDGTVYGFRVRGTDGKTLLYDENGVYNEGITDGAVSNAKIGDDAIDDRVIKAGSILTKHLVADQILADHIATNAINAKHILAGSITAESAIIANGAIGKAQIADASIGSAQIEKLAVNNGHINDLSADKINAGKIKAQFIEVGGESSFADGYNPSVVNSKLRDDLRLTSALPTNITLSNEGIKAATTSDPTKYAILNHEGLYVHNGAIVIQGGLTKDNMDSDTVAEWDTAASFAEQMLNDNILTRVEKITLKRDLDTWVSEHSSIVALSNSYWPVNGTAPTSNTDYLTNYNSLINYLTTSNDLNNGMPVLSDANMKNESQIDGALLSSKIKLYNVAKFKLQEDQSNYAKNLVLEAQKSLDEFEGATSPYKVDIISTNGNVFRNGEISTTLQVKIYLGTEDTTDSIPNDKIIWKRTSDDTTGDITWNTAHASGGKSIAITKDDVKLKATFTCEVLE